MRRSLLTLLLLALLPACVAAQTRPTRLIQSADVTRVGTFRVPTMQDATAMADGTRPYCEYTQGVIAFNPVNQSLFLVCHDWSQSVAEITIPAIGGTATVLQAPRPVANLSLTNPSDPNSKKIGGLLVAGGRLLVNAYSYYDGAGSATSSLFSRSTNLSSSDVTGPQRIGANASFTGGYLGDVPAEWQAALGGSQIAGLCCLSIISRTSFGPALTVFSPSSPAAAVQLLAYPMGHETLGGCEDVGKLFNCATGVRGAIAVPGTRSVLFVGALGQGGICYKSERGPAACRGTGGYAAERYVAHVWAYDLADLMAVKAGSKQPWDVVPYATWTLPGLSASSVDTVGGAAYDAATGRLYVTQNGGDGTKPLIHVYAIDVASTTPTPAPVPTDAVVSDWSAWSSTSAWSACTAGTQTRTERQTRTIITPATNGGSTPDLVQTRTVSQSCTMPAPDPDPTPDPTPDPVPDPPADVTLADLAVLMHQVLDALTPPAAPTLDVVGCTVTSTTVDTVTIRRSTCGIDRPANGTAIKVVRE